MKKNAISIVSCKNFCGEAPIWIEESKQLFWVDTGRNECHKLDCRSGSSAIIKMDGLPQALGKREKGGWICPMENRVVLLNNDFQIEKDLGTPLPSDSPLLIGDGTSGPDGRFYFGVYHPENLTSTEGAVYRVNHDLSFELVITGMALPNGMAFNKEGNKYYLTEMFGNCIWSFDFNKDTGKFSNKTLFTSIPEKDGYPDGLIMDKEGGVWSAHWQGFRVTRYNSDSSIDRIINVPVPTATCMTFAEKGALYITTATKGNSDEQAKEYPEAGNLFTVQTEFTALSERSFKED